MEACKPAAAATSFLHHYDKNGNITGLTRYHGSLNIVDQLSYNYSFGTTGTPDGNKLHKVTDAILESVNAGFFDYNPSYDDYMYDGNGNMTFDSNKGSFVSYNHISSGPRQTYFYWSFVLNFIIPA